MASFRQLLAEGQDEQVSVNQRALVEKILARYSGEYTVFRELLQNSDDAAATNVELHFRTTKGTDGSSDKQPTYPSDSLPDLTTAKISSIMVRNDGFVFRGEDWSRLTEIASGNPDETKIGAFGVGFYALFSLCDEPVVSSGNKVVGFYWKNGGDQLYVKSAVDEAGLKDVSPEGKPWTTFSMEVREPAPMPEPNDFARFLSSCLGFTQNLRTLSLHFDGHRIFTVTKTLAPGRPLALRQNLQSTSPQKLLRVTEIEEAPFQLKAEVSRWMLQSLPRPKPSVAAMTSAAASSTTSFASKMLAAFSGRAATPKETPRASPSPTAPYSTAPPSKDPLGQVKVTLFLRTVAASLKVSPSAHFANEMLRATKKALPSTTRYSLVWTGKDEYEASRGATTDSDETDARKVFSGLLPTDLGTVQGRVAIGFATHQTSGFAGSVGARFISTVERESLDFQAKYVAEWNRELLWAGGVLARTVFEAEMDEVARIWKAAAGPTGTAVDAVLRSQLEQRVLHLVKFFSFDKSTPQEIVGSLTENSFFASNASTSPMLLSTVGPSPAHKLRLPSPQLAGFVKSIPVVPSTIADGAPRFLTTLRDRGLVRDISLDDVFADLSSHALTIDEAAECLKWWTTLAADRSYNPRLLDRLKDATMLSVPEAENSSEVAIRPLDGYRTFVNPKVVPLDMPLPTHTLPFALSRQLSSGDLVRVFDFRELSLVDWFRHVTSPSLVGSAAAADTNLLLNAVFAEKVIAVLAKGWQQVAAPQQAEIVEIASKLAFVPTREGLKVPGQAYFPNVSLFDDLAIVALPSGATLKGNLERVLLALGVRRHVELQLIFTRLLGAGDWSHVQLLRYLVSVKETLSAAERDRLRKTSWLPREGEAKVAQPAGPDGVVPKPKTVRYRASELYEPTDTLRELGLPILEWSEPHSKWRTHSDEAKLLFELGLIRTPPVEKVLEIAAHAADSSKRDKALRYFLDGFATLGYASAYSPTKHALPFVPAVENGREVLKKPTEVFGNQEAALLGFSILSPRFATEETRFGVRRDPPTGQLVAALVANPPKAISEASKIFAYLSSQVSHFSSTEIEALRWAAIIPSKTPELKLENLPPMNLYFQTSESTLPSGLRSLFRTVPDFGPAARPFLVACGVKESPSTSEIATLLISDPSRFYDLAGSSERYLAVLRLLAVNFSTFSTTLRSKMKLSACFLGTKRLASTTNGTSGRTLLDLDEDEDEGGETTLVYKLARASELIINDEPAAFHVFQSEILACPQEDLLEALAEQLGSRRISQLISEQYFTSGASNSTSPRAQDLRRTVSERTFLFLSERRQQYGKGELKHDPEWIQKHLQLHEVKTIELVRELRTPQGVKRATAAASACAKTLPNGDIGLYISQSLELDFYEVAMGLCKLLLSKLRANDALLLLTILQTTLKNLKRRGFNVDRILQARKSEREAADQRLREERLQAQLKTQTAPAKLDEAAAELLNIFPDADPAFLRTFLSSRQPASLEEAANELLANGYPKRQTHNRPPAIMPPPSQAIPAHGQQQPALPGANGGGLFSNLRRQFGKGDRVSSPLPPPPSLTPASGGGGGDAGAIARSGGGPTQAHQSGSTPTSVDAIRANLTRAIQAARPESGSNVSNTVEQTEVNEVKESGAYCDATAAANLAFVAEVGGLRFFVSREVPDPTTFVSTHHDALLRFATRVIRPVGDVFGLDPRALHIFHDLEGPLIAFNRNGSIYLNFRFYQAWHDRLVVDGRMDEPLISTFSSIAHELSHNLVKPHDSAFSFYFASFCEEYFIPMAKLLSRVSATA
ncbi:hypothetical protein JCM10908_001550 [Rhodotorula pacifica]|uniref:DUF3684 domain-containing protein n=1 Tax=Rhodotorula pacifica TaxID=1495444 RepID=UPI0031716563